MISDSGTEVTRVMLAIGSLLQSQSDVDALLARVLDLVAESMSADRARLFLVDRDRQELYSHVAHLPELSEIRLPIGRGIAGHVAATGEASIAERMQDDDRFEQQIDELTGYTTQTLLAVPVFASDRDTDSSGNARVVGVLDSTLAV